MEIVESFAKDIGVVKADPDRMRQIGWNLLSNAVKFTPPGGKVEIRSMRDGDEVKVEVRDTGVGISPEFLPKMFERFTQADSTIARVSGGLGLGLAITKQLVELHGGTITAESEGVGKGASFTVRLPLPRERNAQARAGGVSSRARRGEEHLAAVKLLLVEDEAQTRRALATLLKQAGVKVTAVSTAAEALAAFEKSEWDVVVSDISMPAMDGYTLLQTVRELEKSRGRKEVPAVALTAFAREEDRQRAVASGFQAHITKPVDPDHFLSVLGMMVREG